MLPLFLFINFYIIEKTYSIYTYILFVGSVEGLLWGAEPRFELVHALQQADAILSESGRTLSHKHEVEYDKKTKACSPTQSRSS